MKRGGDRQRKGRQTENSKRQVGIKQEMNRSDRRTELGGGRRGLNRQRKGRADTEQQKAS